MSAHSYRLIKKAAHTSECLTTRQLALMIYVINDKIIASVEGYAKLLKINKPAVTRAADRLCKLGFLSREQDLNDKRKIIIQATQKGIEFLNSLSQF